LDMMLEAGINVRVVPFPEGEDPDSFAQKHSTEELEKFLAEQRKDFISYKTSVLLEEVGNDPLKRAEMVRDVVGSISKVPDAIGQEVFIKEAAKILDIDPRALHEELARLLIAQNRQARRKQAEAPPMEALPPTEKMATPFGHHQEEKVIHLIVARGVEDMLEEDLDPEEVVPISITEWAVENIDKDKIPFETPVFQRMYDLVKAELEAGHVPDSGWWIMQEDAEVVEVATKALTEPYVLSDWKRKDIYLPVEKNTIKDLVEETVLRFKSIWVERKLNELKAQFNAENVDIDYYMTSFDKWNKVRQQINEELNRIV
jgi:DNA primase